MPELDARAKAILCGLFLSKFDSKGLKYLGFDSFREAFNVLGLAINIKPASIRSYRDELDPLFPNARLGWHKRKLREHCRKVFETFGSTGLEEMAFLVSSLTGCGLTQSSVQNGITESDTFAKRLLTGRAAENYFLQNYHSEPEFSTSKVIDVTQLGCGYDFRVHHNTESPFYAVEVKGMRSEKGGFSLTNKEYMVADSLREAYFIYIVKDFDETPYAVKYRNPLFADLNFKRVERKILQITWSASL